MEGFKTFIKKNIGFIATILTLAVFVSTSIFTISKTGKTLAQVIGDGALFFGVSMFVCSLLLWQGLLEGESDVRVLRTNYMFACTVEVMSPYVNLLSIWCEKKNRDILARERKMILVSAGLRYDDYFDKEGNVVKEYEPVLENLNHTDKFKRRIERKKMTAYENALNPKTARLEPQILMGGAKNSQEIYKMSLTKGGYTANALSKRALWGIAFAVVFGIYTYKVREYFSWEALIWYSLQACICLGSGILQFIQSRMFVTDDLRSQTVRKVNFLDECRSDIRNKPEMFKGETFSLPPEKIERNYDQAKEKYLKENVGDECD